MPGRLRWLLRLRIARPDSIIFMMAAILWASLVSHAYLLLSALSEFDVPQLEKRIFFHRTRPTVMIAAIGAPLGDRLGQADSSSRMSIISGKNMSATTFEFRMYVELVIQGRSDKIEQLVIREPAVPFAPQTSEEAARRIATQRSVVLK